MADAGLARWSSSSTARKFAVNASAVKLTLPDPKLRYNAETKHWEFGEIDWAEFKQVISGNGPCNRERLEARRAAHDEGAWVREAAAAFAEKQRGRSAAPAA